MKITIIGAGNIGGAIARGLAKGHMFKASDITCTAQSDATLEKIRNTNPDFVLSLDNVEAVKGADIIIIAVKPWRVEEIIDQIKGVLNYDKQIIVSVAAGITFDLLNTYLTKNTGFDDCLVTPTIFRIMPNTAIEVLSSMTFVAARNASKEQTDLIVTIFNELGNAMLVEERLMSAGTALASSGIAFALRYIRAAIEGGVELGFYPKQAQEIVVHTVKGAVDLLLENKSNPEMEIDKVTTPEMCIRDRFDTGGSETGRQRLHSHQATWDDIGRSCSPSMVPVLIRFVLIVPGFKRDSRADTDHIIPTAVVRLGQHMQSIDVYKRQPIFWTAADLLLNACPNICAPYCAKMCIRDR